MAKNDSGSGTSAKNGKVHTVPNAQAILGNSLQIWEQRNQVTADLFDRPVRHLSAEERSLRAHLAESERLGKKGIIATFAADTDAARTRQIDPERARPWTT